MISARVGAIVAAVSAIFATAAPAFACRVSAVEGYTGGPSLIRVAIRAGRACTIPHYTITSNGRGTRVLRTLDYRPVDGASRGRVAIAGNRVTYRGRGNDRFAYDFTDRAGYGHQVRAHVVRR